MTFIRDTFEGIETLSRPRRKRPKCSRTKCSHNGIKANDIIGPSELASLAVLGVVSEGCRTLGEITTAARSIASCDWQPTGDLLAGAVTKAIEDGHLRAAGPRAPRQEKRYRISSSGRAKLRALLTRHSPRCRDSLGRASTNLKICFLGALDPEQAMRVLQDLAARHLSEIQTLRTTGSACPASTGFAGRCLAREIQRLEQEQAWLESLTADLPQGGRAAF